MELGRRGFVTGAAGAVVVPAAGLMDTTHRLRDPAVWAVVQRLQAVVLHHGGVAAQLSPGSRELTPGVEGIRRAWADLPGRRQESVRRGCGWLESRTDLRDAGRWTRSLARRASMSSVPADVPADVLAATTLAICAAAPRLSGSGDAVAGWWWAVAVPRTTGEEVES